MRRDLHRLASVCRKNTAASWSCVVHLLLHSPLKDKCDLWLTSALEHEAVDGGAASGRCCCSLRRPGAHKALIRFSSTGLYHQHQTSKTKGGEPPPAPALTGGPSLQGPQVIAGTDSSKCARSPSAASRSFKRSFLGGVWEI